VAFDDDQVGANYIRHELIGSGAMGRVFRGTTRDGSVEVAIKILRSELAEDQVFVSRFIQERAIMTRLDGPGVVKVFDLIIEGGRLAIVMELVSGGTLRDALTPLGRALSEVAAVRVAIQILRGLEGAHAQGIIHRDIKPENILLTTVDGSTVAKLTDFGISGLATSSVVTRLTGFVGTPTYMAPEMVDDSPITSAVDVYGLGVVLYEMINAGPPFAAENPLALLRKHVNDQPARLSTASDRVWNVLSQMLMKSPLDRPSAQACADELQVWLADKTSTDRGELGSLMGRGVATADSTLPSSSDVSSETTVSSPHSRLDFSNEQSKFEIGEVLPAGTVVSSERHRLLQGIASTHTQLGETTLVSRVATEETHELTPVRRATRKRPFVIGTLAVVIIAAVALVVVASQHSNSPKLSAGPPLGLSTWILPSGAQPSTVACVTTDDCEAFGNDGIEYSTRNDGKSWTNSEGVSRFHWTSQTCSALKLCVLISAVKQGEQSFAMVSYARALTHSFRSVPVSTYVANAGKLLVCGPGQTCINGNEFVSQNSPPLKLTSLESLPSRAVPVGSLYTIYSMSCPTLNVCVAATAGGVQTWTRSTFKWTTLADQVPNLIYASPIQCSNQSDCGLVTFVPGASSHIAHFFTTKSGGKYWRKTSVDLPKGAAKIGSGGLPPITWSCFKLELCAVSVGRFLSVGSIGNGFEAMSTTNSGNFDDIQCNSTVRCFATGFNKVRSGRSLPFGYVFSRK
jgi:serine/threonine protein kinase